MNSLISVKNVSMIYDKGLIQALDSIDLELKEGKIYALVGPSGCGKSTLLSLIGTLDTPTSGHIYYEGKALHEIGPIHRFRERFFGFVFQFHHLIPVLTLRENVEAALLSNPKLQKQQRYERAQSLLEKIGIAHRADAYATEISGGERQRGAIARAFANIPKLILADEPTGSVDSKTAKAILTTLQAYVKKTDATILIATHDQQVSAIADVLIEMVDGAIVSMTERSTSL